MRELHHFSKYIVRRLSHTPTRTETMSCAITVLVVFVRAQGFGGAEWLSTMLQEQPSIVMPFYLSHDAVHIQAGKEAAGKFCRLDEKGRPCCLPKTQHCKCKILHRTFSGFYTSCFLEGRAWQTMLSREVRLLAMLNGIFLQEQY